MGFEGQMQKRRTMQMVICRLVTQYGGEITHIENAQKMWNNAGSHRPSPPTSLGRFCETRRPSAANQMMVLCGNVLLVELSLVTTPMLQQSITHKDKPL
eukprot:5568056-Amphidinium_carterae.2